MTSLVEALVPAVVVPANAGVVESLNLNRLRDSSLYSSPGTSRM